MPTREPLLDATVGPVVLVDSPLSIDETCDFISDSIMRGRKPAVDITVRVFWPAAGDG